MRDACGGIGVRVIEGHAKSWKSSRDRDARHKSWRSRRRRTGAFHDHTLIPSQYSYEGANASPPLEWRGIPKSARELVLLCEDPDAPSGTFTHWVVTNISPRATGVAEGGIPDGGVLGRNGFGELGWGGPRPPIGDDPHRYFFRLYAADAPLGLAEGATAEQLHHALDGHTLERGTLVGLFGR
jgi:Raf kinase inhibitor-like YbhB/YbcL family protein